MPILVLLAAGALAAGPSLPVPVGHGVLPTSDAPPQTWKVTGPEGATVDLSVTSWPWRVKWTAAGKIPGYETEHLEVKLPKDGVFVTVQPGVAFLKEEVRYLLDVGDTPGIVLTGATPDAVVARPYAIGDVQVLHPDGKGGATLPKKPGDGRVHPFLPAVPMHEWQDTKDGGATRRTVVVATGPVQVLDDHLRSVGTGPAVQFWLKYDGAGVGRFFVIPAKPGTKVRYSVHVGAPDMHTPPPVASYGAPSAADRADAWERTRASLARRVDALEGQLAFAISGSERQIDVLGTKETDHYDATYYRESDDGAYQAYWSAQKATIERELADARAALAAHEASRP